MFGQINRMRVRSGIVARRWLVSGACACSIALWAGGCATNPLTGRAELNTMSRAREAALGRESAEAVEESMGIVDDAGLRAYVKAVGGRVAAFSPRRDVTYRFDVVDSDIANAFALPGGYIYVSRGLLAIINSEAELAGVLGHEVIHVAGRHGAQSQTRAGGFDMLAKMGALAGAAVGGATTGAALGDLGQLMGAGLVASYSRDQEREADRYGQDLAAKAGYPPLGLPRALRALEADASSRSGGEGGPGFFDSHPGTAERILKTTRAAATLTPGPSRGTRESREEFLAELDGMRIGPGASRGVFQRSSFVHPELGVALDFPSGWRGFKTQSRALAVPAGRDGLVEIALDPVQASDPESAARTFLAGQRASILERESTEVGGFRAYRVAGSVRDKNGSFYVEWTFVEHPRGILRLTATAPVTRRRDYQEAMRKATESLRKPSAGELARIRELRMRIVAARAGERLEDLARRAASRWSVEQLARANGIDASQPLAEGFPVKVVVIERYTP